MYIHTIKRPAKRTPTPVWIGSQIIVKLLPNWLHLVAIIVTSSQSHL